MTVFSVNLMHTLSFNGHNVSIIIGLSVQCGGNYDTLIENKPIKAKLLRYNVNY